MNGAIVGFGNVAQFGHYPAYVAGADAGIIAVVETSATRRLEAESVNPGLHIFSSIDEVPAELGIDFVDICTQPSLHFAPMMKSISRGWHVLCEKPLLLEVSAFEEAKRGASKANVAIVPAHNWKYAPIIRRATDLLHTIGQLLELEIVTLRKGSARSAEESWRQDVTRSGGGILMDHGWHAIYLALGWFGDRPIDVSADLHRSGTTAAEDEALVTLTFPRGNARIDLSWNANERSNRIRLRGERGEIRISNGELHSDQGFERFEPLSAGSHHADWFAAMLPDVLRAFRHPPLARPQFDEAATCFEIIRHAYDHARWR